MNRQVAVGIVLFGLVVGLAWMGAAPRSAAQGELQPITAANAAQVRPVLSVPGWYDYHGFSPDGSLLATSSLVIPPHLWRIADGSAVPISAPGSYKAFSPHGELLAVTAGWTGTMIWDMAADREILSVEGTFYAFSPDGAYLVTKGEDAWYLWDVSTGEQLEILNWDTNYSWLRFSPDGSWLAWSGFDGVVNVWDLRAHDRIAELYKGATNGLFTADSALLITRHGNTLSGWDTATWSVRYSYLVGDDNYLALSADGSVLIARNCFNQGDCRVHLFRLAGTELSQACTLPIAPESKPYDPPWLSLSPDGRYLFSRVDVGPAVLWDLTTCDPLPLPLANEDRVFSGFFNPDASLLFVQVLADRKHPHSLTALHIIEMGTWNELAVLAGNGFILSPDSSTLISVVEGFTLLYGVPDSARPVGRVLIPAAILPSAITLRAAPDPNAEVVGTARGFVLAGGRNGAYVYLADLDGWVNGGEEYIALRDNLPLDYLPEYDPAEVVVFVPPPTSISYPTSTPTPLPTPTSLVPTPTLPPPTPLAAALSPSAITAQQASQIALLDVIPDYLTGTGNTAITWSWNTQRRESVLRIWDMVALEQRAELIIAASNYYYKSEDIALSPNGMFLAMIDPTNEHTIQVWDTRSGQQIAALEAHLAPVAKFTLSPDERLLASVERPSIRARDSAVKLWGLPTGDLVAQLPLDGSRVESLIFSPNGSWLGAATKDTKTHIWDMASGTLRYTLPTYSDYLAFSLDGTVLLTVYQHTGRLWNLESGGMITEIDCPTPKTVLFSPDNTRLLMNYSGYSLQLWDSQNGASLGLYNAGTPIQAPDGRGWLALAPDGVLRLWDFADGAECAALPLTRRGELALSPDNRLLAVGVKLVDLATWTAYTLPHSTYPVPETVQDMAWRRTPMPRFSPDGTHLFVTGEVLMVYGLPDEVHPAWEPITARVIPTGIHLHDEPGKSPGVIGTISGDIVVGGQALSLVYLPEAGGWVWPEYIDLRPYTLDDLPELWPD